MKITRALRSVIIMMSLIILMTGCSKEKSLLRNAEIILKHQIGNDKSYSRTQWGIADTVFQNDLKIPVIGDSITIHEEKLKKTEASERLQTVDLLKLRQKISKKAGSGRKTDAQNVVSKPKGIIAIENHYRIYSVKDLDKAIADSLYLVKEIGNEHNIINLLGTEYDSLSASRRTSPIQSITVIIRFTSKLESMPEKFKSIIDYDFKTRQYKIRETTFDKIKIDLPK